MLAGGDFKPTKVCLIGGLNPSTEKAKANCNKNFFLFLK